MQTYQSHKTVKAFQINHIVKVPGTEIHTLKGTHGESANVDDDYMEKHRPKLHGYYVLYADGYESWSPAKAFEEGYSLVMDRMVADGMTFGQALELLKHGGRATRPGWNGVGMFIFLVPGSRFEVNRPPLLGIYEEGTEINYHAHIDMRTANGQIVPWLASQTDMLAEDWMALPAEQETEDPHAA